MFSVVIARTLAGMNNKFIVAFIIGLMVGGILTTILLPADTHHSDRHPIADPFDTKYHVHADFHIVIRDTLVDLSSDIFQTTNTNTRHHDAHLHDNNGEVKHIHAEEITFVEFLDSLSIGVTDSCITFDNEYCSGETEKLLLFVNNELYTQPITSYVPVDDDRILLYYGTFDSEIIQPFLEAIPNDSCYYSGTCPERGVAPPESCGETCEL